MKDGAINEFDGTFDDYASAAAFANQPNKPATNKKIKNLPVKANNQPKAPVAFESLINEAETVLNGINGEIESCLAASDYEKIKGLYLKKQQIEERVALLYDEWAGDS